MTKGSEARKVQRLQKREGGAVHTLVRDTAVAMAHAAYEALMQRNDWYDLYKRENPGLRGERLERAWVNAHWAQYINPARAQLAAMLSRPLDDGLRDQIAEALILDNTLVRQREAGTNIVGKVN